MADQSPLDDDKHLEGPAARMAAGAQDATIKFVKGMAEIGGQQFGDGADLGPLYAGVLYGVLQAFKEALDPNVSLGEFKAELVRLIDDYIAQEREGMN